MATLYQCPSCTAENRHEDDVDNLTIITASPSVMRLGITCVNCGQVFEGAPDGSGTFTTIQGRLHRVADSLAHATRQELELLRAEVEELKRVGDATRATEFLIDKGWAAPEDESTLARTNEALDVILKLAALLAALLAGGSWSAEQIHRLFESLN